MREIVVEKHVKAGTEVSTGYSGIWKKAPAEDGMYTLYELANEHNQHEGWKMGKGVREASLLL